MSAQDQPTSRTIKDPLQMAMKEQQAKLEEKTDEIAKSVTKNFQNTTTNLSGDQSGNPNNDYCTECKYQLDDDGIDRSLDGMGRILESQMKGQSTTGKTFKSPLTTHTNEDLLPTQKPPEQA